MRLSYRSWSLVLLVLIYSSMLSCGILQPIPVTAPDKIEPDWLDKTTSISPGKTNRASVRALLGDPLLSSDYWNLDIFRRSAKQHEVDLVLLLPVFYAYRTFYRYTLVTYDENNTVNELATGLVRASDLLLSPGGMQDEYYYRWLRLDVHNFTFIYDPVHGSIGILLLDPPNTAAYLQSLNNLTQCIATVGSETPYRFGYPAYFITFDNGARRVAMPSRPFRSLAILPLSPGRHTIEVSENGVSGKTAKSFHCEKGEVLYIAIDNVAYERQAFWKTFLTLNDATATFRIDLFEKMPDTFVDLSQIIWSEGQWLVNPGKGRYSPDTLFTHPSKQNP